jgi:hypothetical protein
MSDLYKFAAQNRLRFPSKKGELTVEDLFQLPLKSQTGFDLDTVARAINAQLKGVSEDSFVDDPADDPRKTSLRVSLDIVKDVIATKQAENRAVVAKAHKTAERKKLLDAIAAKRDQQLTAASLDELEKKLAELDN